MRENMIEKDGMNDMRNMRRKVACVSIYDEY
jgi:hypothetical protein